jgi:hypothetical protein
LKGFSFRPASSPAARRKIPFDLSRIANKEARGVKGRELGTRTRFNHTKTSEINF